MFLKVATAWGTSKPLKAYLLASLAGKLATADPDRAERIAHSITDKNTKARALASVAGMLATTDPDRGERIAHSITDKSWMAGALARVAKPYSRVA
jgi:hypothetical protein